MANKNKEHPSKQKECIIITTSGIMFLLSLYLLLTKSLDGSSFVAFIGVVLFGSLLIYCLPNIIEVTIAGNTLKLKEKINQADLLIEKLSALKSIFISQQLMEIRITASKFDGAQLSVYRLIDFFNKIILDDEAIETHKNEIESAVKIVAESCLKKYQPDC